MFSISKQQLITWSEEVAQLFPGTSRYVFYTPYKSTRVEELMPNGEKISRLIKSNATGCFINHLSYIQKKLNRQQLVEANAVQPQVVEVVVEINGMEKYM